MPDAGITWNYTTWLNIVFLILAALLTLRFFRTGGRQMLAMMGGAPTSDTQHGDAPADDGVAERALRPTRTIITTSSPAVDSPSTSCR